MNCGCGSDKKPEIWRRGSRRLDRMWGRIPILPVQRGRIGILPHTPGTALPVRNQPKPTSRFLVYCIKPDASAFAVRTTRNQASKADWAKVSTSKARYWLVPPLPTDANGEYKCCQLDESGCSAQLADGKTVPQRVRLKATQWSRCFIRSGTSALTALNCGFRGNTKPKSGNSALDSLTSPVVRQTMDLCKPFKSRRCRP